MTRRSILKLLNNSGHSYHCLKKHRIRLAIENHEDETADEIIDVISAVDSVWIGAHCDIGNGMMAWEEPVHTVKKTGTLRVQHPLQGSHCNHERG